MESSIKDSGHILITDGKSLAGHWHNHYSAILHLIIISVKRAQISLVPFLLIELICSAMNKEFLETHTILEKVRIAR